MKPTYSTLPAWGRGLGLLAMLAAATTAPAQSWQSAVLLGPPGAGNVEVRAVATDAQGNAYLTGHFNGAVSFGSLGLSSGGDEDVFVAKWNAGTASFAWVLRAGGSSRDEGHAIAVEGSNVYITGFFYGPTASFGPVTLSNSTPGGNISDTFVAKLVDQGSTAAFGWVAQSGGAGREEAHALAVSGSSVYVAGAFTGTARFGATALTSPGANDEEAFVARLDDAGSTAAFAWARQAGGPGYDAAQAVAVSGADVYLAGYFGSRTASFGSLTLNNNASSGSGAFTSKDGFVARLSDAGGSASFVGALRLGGATIDEATALAVSGTTVYVGGYYEGSATFGAYQLSTAGLRQGFVARLAGGGSPGLAWVLPVGSPQLAEVASLAARGGAVYLSGYYVDTFTLGGVSLPRIGDQDIFVARLSDAGSSASCTWAQAAGGRGSDVAQGLATAATGMLYAAGLSEVPAAFGSFSLTGAANYRGGFLASILDAAPLAATPLLAAPDRLYPNPARRATTLPLPAGVTSVALIDALGRSVRTQPLPAGAHETEINLLGLVPGLYLVRVQAGGQQFSQRLVVE